MYEICQSTMLAYSDATYALQMLPKKNLLYYDLCTKFCFEHCRKLFCFVELVHIVTCYFVQLLKNKLNC